MAFRALVVSFLAVQQAISSPIHNAANGNASEPALVVQLSSLASLEVNGSHAAAHDTTMYPEKRQDPSDEQARQIDALAQWFVGVPTRNDCFFVTVAHLLQTTVQDISARTGVPVPAEGRPAGISINTLLGALTRLHINFRVWSLGEQHEQRAGQQGRVRPSRVSQPRGVSEALALPPRGLPRLAGVAYRRRDGSGHVVVVRGAGTPFRRYVDYQADPNGRDVTSDVRNSRIFAYFGMNSPEPMDVDAHRPTDQPMDIDQTHQGGAGEPMDVADQGMLNQLRQGTFGGLNCAALLATLTLSKHFPKRSVLHRRGDETCEQARKVEAMLSQQDQPPCQIIRDLEFGFRLADENWAGTYDRIGAVVQGSSGSAVLTIGDAPSRGLDKWSPVDLKATFGAESIDLAAIDKISLTAQGIFENSWTPLKNDKWKVQDIQMRAKCADPAFSVENQRLISLNTWFGHPGGWLLEPFGTKTVATFNVSPLDWIQTPPCAVIRDIHYEFKLGNDLSGGTYDSIAFTLGDGKPVVVGESLDRGVTRKGSVDLQAVFGLTTVDIRSLTKLDMIDTLGSGNGDQWKFEGITFTASCADGNEKISLNKFAAVNQWLGHDSAKEVVWSGGVAPQDWQKS